MYPHIAFSVCLVPCLPKKFLRMWEKDPVLQESDESLENREGYSIKYSANRSGEKNNRLFVE